MMPRSIHAQERAAAHASRDGLLLGQEMRDRIAYRLACEAAAAIEAEVDAPMTDAARAAYVEAAAVRILDAIAPVALPPIVWGEIGGTEPAEAA